MAEDKNKTRDEILRERELSELRGRIAELEQLAAAQGDVAQRLQRQGAVLDGINRILREALTLQYEAEVAAACLSVAEELTGSKFGFIGVLNEAGLFDTIAISNPGWDVCTMPHSEATKLIKNMQIRGLDRSMLREGRSRIVNDPASHPDRVGTPQGHPPITCFLGVPLKRGNKTIGMFALANKESGYEPADQQAVEALSESFVQVLLQKQAERKHRAFREHLERMLEERSAKLAAAREALEEEIVEHRRAGEKLQRIVQDQTGSDK